MLYKKKAIEILGEKEVFGKVIVWIRVLEDNSFHQVALEDLELQEKPAGLSYIRYTAVAAKIKDEVAKKNILAPYESSLIPLPHQILVLEKVMHASQNRFLLADEVGMGKTIEAGLILKELKLRGEIKRILIIVPKSAMMQWQSELKEHFNEVFHLYDSEMISSLARTFSNINSDEEFNFWTQHNQIIVSTDALKPLEKRQGWSQERVDEYNKYRMQGVLNADFDLVIIDEAHKMGGASTTVSRYILAQELCNTVNNVLLLTATPHRGKSDHFRRVLQLLDPDAFAGDGLPDIDELEPYVIRTEKRLAVDYDGNKLFNERETHRFEVILDTSKHQKQLKLYADVTEYVRKGFNAAKKSRNIASGLIMVLLQRLISSSTVAILSVMERRLLKLQNGEIDDLDGILDSEASKEELLEVDILDTSGVYQNSYDILEYEEQYLADLIAQAKECINTETDAKADALLAKVVTLQQENNNRELKVLIFTEFRSTQKMLLDFFENEGYSCVSINGSQELDERKRALVNFRNNAQILVATDAAGESLNMQFCHIVFNYDLPWNPMVIEQRIGRVDRIGQKHKVQAYNMLTNNSIDKRVYQVITEKLNAIIQQLGIDKTADVLDSAIDMQKINKLYLQSLLDPERFEFAGEKWLHEIKNKLKDFQSTEGILPRVAEKEIDSKSAAEIKHSPLPHWLETLVIEKSKIEGNSISKNLLGYLEINSQQNTRKVTFDAEVVMFNADVEHLTLQHDWIKKLLNDIDGQSDNGEVSVLKFNSTDETSGYWSLWEITAQNNFESKVQFQSFFVADNGKQYNAYANDIWNRLIAQNVSAKFVETRPLTVAIKSVLNEALFTAFQNLEADLLEKLAVKKKNKLNAFAFRKTRIDKIGIDNIRASKSKRLEREQLAWQEDFQKNVKVIPGLKQLLTIRIDA